jgi:ArsR family transcriptional regulator, arsenate/arsenite/antimonite-responsive transcriptional repressor
LQDLPAGAGPLWREGRQFRYTQGRLMDRSQVEKISKALADETRLMIFEAICSNDHMNCGEIVSLRGVTPATVSHHLKILSEAGLIACRREGQFVYSQTVPETIKAYTLALARIARKKKTPRRR